jgi:hypothetical protein
MFIIISFMRSISITPSGVTYMPPFYVVRSNISDYANMVLRPSGMMHTIYKAADEAVCK